MESTPESTPATLMVLSFVPMQLCTLKRTLTGKATIEPFTHSFWNTYQASLRSLALAEMRSSSIWMHTMSAAVRLFGTTISLTCRSMIPLSFTFSQVHLPNQQSVVYNPEQDAQDVLNSCGTKDTTLTGWFRANAELDLEEIHNLLYQDFPSLNQDQHTAFEKIMSAITTRSGEIFFLHGPRCSGKTYLYNTLCYHFRS